jgi:hypothetical protein
MVTIASDIMHMTGYITRHWRMPTTRQQSSEKGTVMRRIVLGLVLSLVLCLPFLASAFPVCWRLQNGATPPQDILDFWEFSATEKRDTPSVAYELHGCDKAAPLYQGCGSGTVMQDENNPSTFALGVPFTHIDASSPFFGGNYVCEFNASINAVEGPGYLNGTWRIQCAGSASGPFNVSGFLRFVACQPLTLRPAQAMAVTPAQVRAMSERVEGAIQEHLDANGDYVAAGLGNFVNLPAQ